MQFCAHSSFFLNSGNELEMMEAEAKDSEDEAEETSFKQYAVENMHKSPNNLKASFPEEHKSPKFVAEALNILPDSTLPKAPLNVNTVEDRYPVDGVENRSSEASSLDNVLVSKALGYQDARSLKQNPYSELPEPHYHTPDGKNASSNLTSNSRSVERPPHSDEQLSARTVRKTPRRLGDLSCNGSGLDREPLGNLIVDLSSSILVPTQAKNKFGPDYAEASQKGIDSHSGVKPTDFSPPKEIRDCSYGSPSLQKISSNVKSCIRKSPSPSGKIFGLQPISTFDASHETDVSRAPFGNGGCFNEFANVNSAIESRSTDLTIKSSNFTKSPSREHSSSKFIMSESGQHANVNEKTSPSTFERLKTSFISSVPDFNKFVMESSTPVATNTREAQNGQQEVKGSASNGDPGINNSNGPSSSNLVGDENLVTKPLRKKTVAKKTLGARPKIGSTANQKGSIYLGKKNTSQNDAATCLSGEEIEKSNLTKKPELSSVIANDEAPTKAERKDANKSGDNAVRKIESPDNETESPDEKVELVSEKVFKEQNDVATEKKLTGMQHSSNDTTANIEAMALEQGKEGNESENAVNTISDQAEPSSKGGSLKRKKHKEKTCTVDKPKKKKVLDVTEEIKSKEPVDSEEIQNENNEVTEIEEKRAVTGPVAKSKHRNVSKKKVKKSVEEEKENKPINSGSENKSSVKKQEEKSAVKSNVTPTNIKQSTVKCSPNSSRQVGTVTNGVKTEPVMFILSGHRFQRKEFQSVIRRLKGKFCRDSHQWSYQATHFIAPDPIRRTEKFFAAAASGR